MHQYLKSLFFQLSLIVTLTPCFLFSHSTDVVQNQLSNKELNQMGRPTIGSENSKVHVIVFEEPKCPNCKVYSTLIFPLLKKNYIDKNQVRYTFVPISFIPGSITAAEAWLCIFEQDSTPNKERFNKFIETTFSNQPSEEIDWANDRTLIELAKEANLQIDLVQIENCLKKHTYRALIEKNTDYGMELMGGDLDTPTVLINGKPVTQITYQEISRAIDKELKK